MRYSSPTIRQLVEFYREISTLNRIQVVLNWDLNVNLPEKAITERGNQVALLTSLIATKWRDKTFQTNLEKAVGISSKLSPQDQAIVRNLSWASKYYLKIPKSLLVEYSKVTSEGFIQWRKAREQNDFSLFSPSLKEIVEFNKQFASHLGYKNHPYDALLDLFEQGNTVKQMDGVFSYLTPRLTTLLKKITKVKRDTKYLDYVDNTMHYSVSRQKNLSLFAIRKMGYDLSCGRMDVSAHPFTEILGRYDIRITNRYKQHDFRESLMIGMHEAGHALYEQGINQDFAGTPLDGGVSLGIHESQSRFWENQIGRSQAFLCFMTPIYQSYFPEILSDIRMEKLFSLFTHVSPSLIRTESDEVTYNLHIALRYELEKGLINGSIIVDELPSLWKKKMKEYLGVVPETDSDGVLQDVHWSYGAIGYFPTYTLGNLYSAQFTKVMQSDLDIEKLAKNGDLGTVLGWLREKIHQYGSLYFPEELCKKVTGEELNPRYFIEYLQKKYL